MVKKAPLKNNQASSTDEMRSISFQDTRARLIRKVCLLERLTVMMGSRLTADPLRMQAMRLRSWLKTAEVYLEDRLLRMISMRVPVFTYLGLYQVGSLIICVRLRASSLDCMTAGALTYPSLGHLTVRILKINVGQSIHIWCPGHSWGLRWVYNKRQQ